MSEIFGLNYEQNKKFHCAIERGYFDGFERDQRTWKHTFVGRFIWKYPSRTKTLDTFSLMLGHAPTWEDMTDDTMRDFVDELKETGIALSSTCTMCKEVKAVLNENKRKIPSTEFMEILSIRGVTATKAVYLTSDEMMRFIRYKPKDEVEKYVHHTFAVCMLTGARVVDAVRLTINNCDIDTNMLSYVPKKTPGIVVRVPVDERRNLRGILTDRPKRSCCLYVYNEKLREICEKIKLNAMSHATRAGIELLEPKYKLISSHTARRTFATNLYLSGISIEDIAMMMGHGKNIETTKNYICAERDFNPNVMGYFIPRGFNVRTK